MPDQINPYLVNAGTQHITLRTGGSFVHHADSFAIARGGHLDLCVLGAFEVAENGDIANWARSPDEPVKQVGGAMDLAIGAKRLWVAMEHITKGNGESRIRRAVLLSADGEGRGAACLYRSRGAGRHAERLRRAGHGSGHDPGGIAGTQRSGVALVMITGIEIKNRSPFVGGAAFGNVGAYERIDGVAIGHAGPGASAQPRDRAAGPGAAQRERSGRVPVSDFVLLRPADAAKGNGRLLYEVNNRGRIMLFANLCAGAAGNQPATAAGSGQRAAAAAGIFAAVDRLGSGRAESRPACRWMCR